MKNPTITVIKGKIIRNPLFDDFTKYILNKILNGDIEVKELKEHYFKKYEQEAKNAEFESLVNH